jgi:hypothetical protein
VTLSHDIGQYLDTGHVLRDIGSQGIKI